MRSCISLCCVALLFGFFPVTSPAQWSTDPAINTPVCTVSDCGYNQTLQSCSDGAGGVIIVWGDKRKEKTNTGGDIFVQKLDVQGVPQWTPDGVMICDTVGEQNMPCIVSDNAGGAFIAWVDARTGQYTGNIYLQHIDASGQTLWTRQGKQITTGNAWFNPSMTADGAGGVFLAYRYGVTPAGIYAQRVIADGTPQYAGNGVAISPAGYYDNPTTAADDSGGVFISYIFTRSDGAWNGYIQRLTAAGTKRYATSGVAFQAQAASQGRTQLASMGRGEVMAAWYDERVYTRLIYVQRFSWNGTPLFAAGGKRVTDGTQDAYYLAMAKDGVGGVLITYLYGYTLRAIGLKGDGLARWDSSTGVVLCNAAKERSIGGMVSPEPGRAVVAWYDYRDYNASNYNSNIYAQTFDTLGQVGWTANGAPVGMAARMQFMPVLVPTINRGVIAAWWDDRNGSGSYSSFRVYAQRINAYGGLTSVSSDFAVPGEFALMQNFPNPCNPKSSIEYAIGGVRGEGLGASTVRLGVYDILGREVALLVNERKEPGTYVVDFDGSTLASGMYFYRLQAGDFVATRKLVLLK